MTDDDELCDLASDLYNYYYKLPVEDIPVFTHSFVEKQLDYFQTAQWYEVLNIVEFLHTQCLPGGSIEQRNFERQINEVLVDRI